MSAKVVFVMQLSEQKKIELPKRSGQLGRLLLLVWFLSIPQIAMPQVGEPLPTSAPAKQLKLKNRSVGVGDLVFSQQPGCLAWQNLGFTEPFLLELDAIASITSHPSTDQRRVLDKGSFLLETHLGQLIAGLLVAVDDRWLTLDSQILGQVRVDRRQVVSIVSADYVGQVVYAGLSDKAPWYDPTGWRDWDLQAGTLTANRQGASILGHLNLPERCELNVSLTWSGAPDFSISLGAITDQNKGQVAGQVGGQALQGLAHAAARLETWNRQVVLVQEVDRQADLIQIAELSDTQTQLELTILLDQTTGRIAVRDAYGRPLGQLHLPTDKPQVGTGVQIVNHGPVLSVDRLEVHHWDGFSRWTSQPHARVILRDGSVIDGTISDVDLLNQSITVASKSGPAQQFPLEMLATGQVQSLESEQVESGNADTNEASSSGGELKAQVPGSEPKDVEVVLMDGSRLKGQWLAGQSGKIIIRSDCVEQPLKIDPQDLRAVVGTDSRWTSDATANRNATLQVGQSTFYGFLVQNVDQADNQTLRWQPHGSRTASHLQPDAIGDITYRQELPVGADGQPTGRLESLFGDVPSDDQPNKMSTASLALATASDQKINFRSGDTIEAAITAIDLGGVHFLSDQTQVRFVPHLQLNSAQINAMQDNVHQPTEEKLRNLTTVPRALKDDPPTHLLVSVSGDYLRGRLLEMDEQWVTVESHREVARIPRSQIAQLIWLHDRDWSLNSSGDEARRTADTTPGYMIHVIHSGRGITFRPVRMQDSVLYGDSPLLGNCDVSIGGIQKILFGPELEPRILQYRKNPWGLSLAELPRAFAQEGHRPQTGQASPLLGKPAPHFTVRSTSDVPLGLKDLQGKVVVLDFWTSWCDDCVNQLPNITQMIDGFSQQQVQLISINVAESIGRIQTTLARLQLNLQVFLDRDGQIAQEYLADTMPQTLVVDQKGQVRWVHGGGNSHRVTEVKRVIEQLLSENTNF